MTPAELQAIRQIIREEIQAAIGNPLAKAPSRHDELAKQLEEKRKSLVDKRAKRAAKAQGGQQ